MAPIKHVLEFDRSTKNCHVYVDRTGTMMPAKIYLPMTDTGPNAPARITLIIEPETA